MADNKLYANMFSTFKRYVVCFFLLVSLQTDLTVNTLLAVQWFEGFEAEYGNVEGISHAAHDI